jgi:rubrerythrin
VTRYLRRSRREVAVSDKPSYLGMLNVIAIAERNAHAYLTAWAAKTPSADVRKVLLTVAAREGEHGMSFAKRINELGYEVRETDDPGFERAMSIVTSDKPDVEKMEELKLHRVETGDEPDLFDGLFRDHSIDIRTGELLGRYIAEERDTGRLLRACYQQLKAAAPAEPTASLEVLEVKVDALCRAVEELRQIVCAQAMPSTAT